MTPFWLKRLYYAALRLPMRINGVLYRFVRQPKEPICVHLGCGQVHYIPGWVNVDANILTARPDVWANLLDRATRQIVHRSHCAEVSRL